MEKQVNDPAPKGEACRSKKIKRSGSRDSRVRLVDYSPADIVRREVGCSSKALFNYWPAVAGALGFGCDAMARVTDEQLHAASIAQVWKERKNASLHP